MMKKCLFLFLCSLPWVMNAQTDTLTITADSLVPARQLQDTLPVADSTQRADSLQTLADTSRREVTYFYNIPFPDYRPVMPDFSIFSAYNYIKEFYDNEQIWVDPEHPFRRYLGRIMDQIDEPPFDTIRQEIETYPYEVMNIPWTDFYIWDSIPMPRVKPQEPFGKQPADSLVTDTLATDTTTTDSLLLMVPMRDSLQLINEDSLLRHMRLSGLAPQDSISVALADSLPGMEGNEPVLLAEDLRDTTAGRDSVVLVVIDSLSHVTVDDPFFPFRGLNHAGVGDSLQVAVDILLQFIQNSDSNKIYLENITRSKTPMWLSNIHERAIRFWLKNSMNDSVTVWVTNPDNHTLRMALDDGVSFRDIRKQQRIDDVKLDYGGMPSGLQEITKNVVKPRRWDYGATTLLNISQGFITYWAKGGESAITSLLDLNAFLSYKNKDKNINWVNTFRQKYGLMYSKSKKVQKNTDLLELTSKFGQKAFGAFDLSSKMVFKSQLTNGYKYPNDSVVVSKFFNPANLVVSVGIDYKPKKRTSIDFSPLTYKGTFVSDTANINQSNYGVPADRKARHEPGASVYLNHSFEPFEDIRMVNKFNVFTNYTEFGTMDIDWEMSVSAAINWFTTVNINTHLIYDDDVVFDVPAGGGETKKSPRIQFKELMSFGFKFTF